MGDKELVKKAYPELLKDLEKDLEELKLQEMDYYKIVARKELYKRHGRKSGTYGYSNELAYPFTDFIMIVYIHKNTTFTYRLPRFRSPAFNLA